MQSVSLLHFFLVDFLYPLPGDLDLPIAVLLDPSLLLLPDPLPDVVSDPPIEVLLDPSVVLVPDPWLELIILDPLLVWLGKSVVEPGLFFLFAHNFWLSLLANMQENPCVKQNWN